jgi:YggT family protein
VGSLITAIQFISFLVTLLVLIHVLISFFLDPFHPLRQTIDRVVGPMLAPIRKVLPSVGMFDFSPIVLLLLIQLAEDILIRIVIALT